MIGYLLAMGHGTSDGKHEIESSIRFEKEKTSNRLTIVDCERCQFSENGMKIEGIPSTISRFSTIRTEIGCGCDHSAVNWKWFRRCAHCSIAYFAAFERLLLLFFFVVCSVRLCSHSNVLLLTIHMHFSFHQCSILLCIS